MVDTLPGYRGMGPVRVGNQAHEHVQHDVYGQIVLSNVQAFFDERLLRPRHQRRTSKRLEQVGERAFARATTSPTRACGSCAPGRAVHTYSALMCWAACDRLANAAADLGLADRAALWRDARRPIRAAIESAPGTRSSAASPPPSAAPSSTPACCRWSTCAS